MGSSVSTPGNYSSTDDPWWAIENEDYILEQPNLSEIFVLIQENGETVRRKVKLVNRDQSASVNRSSTEKDPEKSKPVREQTLEEFKEELQLKRMARQNALSDLRNEITNLRQQLADERELTRKLKNGEVVIEKKDASTSTSEVTQTQTPTPTLNDVLTAGRKYVPARSQLAEVQLALTVANADNLALATELEVVRRQVISLKEVIACSKQMIEVREEQVNQLKDKLRNIEDSLADRELKLMSDSLRQEYDRQLANIRNLRQLYEERARVCAAERENLVRQISIKKDELQAEAERTKTMEERISSMENELETSNKKIISLKTECDEFKFENKSLKEEMGVINKLFSQMLMGFNGRNNLDIDRLTTMLEENRPLLNEMATKEATSEGAGLPKLLFDIVRQANSEDAESSGTQEAVATSSNQPEVAKVATAQEIIGNLPKVWRVLMELLNHHKIENVQFKENGQSEDCYKSVQTPSGPQAELSVSKTYIKLKDLILEKKALQKETNKLKTLNSHLECRLNQQEKRLGTVSLELNKTWHLVGKMQRQHRQLHTNEQILRYQLLQKRRLLNELKDELEYCRKKWAAARAKNAESQLQCDDMRKEFAKRKLEDANMSGESGYSDGPNSDTDEEQPVRRGLHGLFDPKKIERPQSTSPTRALVDEMLPRGESAPPRSEFLAEITDTAGEISSNAPLEQNLASSTIVSEKVVATVTAIPSRVAASTSSGRSSGSAGAVPKQGMAPKKSVVPKQGVVLCAAKHKKKERPKNSEEESLEDMFMRLSGVPREASEASEASEACEANEGNEACEVSEASEANTSIPTEDDVKRADRAERINRLEKQCKSLIAQVIETSENREKLQIQLCRFQDEVPPPQKAVPLEEYLSNKSTDKKSDPFPETTELLNKATSTANRRNERLNKLEEESNLLMNKLRRTSDRSKNMKSRIERIRERCSASRQGSTDSTASIEEASGLQIVEDVPKDSISVTENESSDSATGSQTTGLTAVEEEYTTRRSERLQRLEEEGKILLSKLNHSAQRGATFATKLDELHSRYGSEEKPAKASESSRRVEPPRTETASERLKRLEEEGDQLLARLTRTNERGSELCNKLAEVHEQVTTRISESESTSLECSPVPILTVSSPQTQCKTTTEKLEEVKRRLEESKKLLRQLSGEPRSRTQSESDAMQDCISAPEISRRTVSETNADPNNSTRTSLVATEEPRQDTDPADSK